MHKPLGTYAAVVVTVLVAAAFAVPALAGGKTSNGGTSTITLNGNASFNNPASFTVVDPPVKGLPEMTVQCSQNGQGVYVDTQMMSGSSPYTPTFTLYSSQWAANGGGAADCSAQLYYYTWQGNKETGVVIMATDSFTANG
jgi:hypothetical protein